MSGGLYEELMSSPMRALRPSTLKASLAALETPSLQFSRFTLASTSSRYRLCFVCA